MPPIRDILVATTVFGSLPFCFLRPWIGILVWSWLGYMNPHRLTWGFAYYMNFAQMVAIATLAGLILTKEKYPLPTVRETYLLAGLWVVFYISTLFAYYPLAAWGEFNKVSKIFLMVFVTMVLIQDREKIKALLWVIVLSIGFFGAKGGIFALSTGGGHMVLGPDQTFISGNTELGMAMTMVLPIILSLRRGETNVWMRHFLGALFGLSIIAILATYSRGAFLGLLVVLSLLFLKSRVKVWVTILVMIAVPLTFSFLPTKWFNRMETIQSYEEDTSAMGRIVAWQAAIEMARQRPILGFGFRPFRREMLESFGVATRGGRDAHSIFFQVLAEHGFTGFILYVGLIASTFLSLRRLIRVSRKDPALQWVYDYSEGLQASLAAFVVCGAFLSMSYFDLFYHLLALVIIFKWLVLVHQRQAAQAGVRAVLQPKLATPALR